MLTSWLGWLAIFFINVPIGVVTLGLSLHLVPVMPRVAAERQRLDLAGSFTAVAAPTLLVFTISSAARSGWLSPAVLVALARQPVIPPAVWGIRSLVSSSVIMLGATALMAGAFFLNSLYLQRALGISALTAGLSFLPSFPSRFPPRWGPTGDRSCLGTRARGGLPSWDSRRQALVRFSGREFRPTRPMPSICCQDSSWWEGENQPARLGKAWRAERTLRSTPETTFSGMHRFQRFFNAFPNDHGTPVLYCRP